MSALKQYNHKSMSPRLVDRISHSRGAFTVHAKLNMRCLFHVAPKEGSGCPCTVYPKKYAHGFSFAVLCCAYTLTDFPISIRLTSLALWQSNDCPSASKATLMNMDKYFMWIHYEQLHNHNKAKHNKTVCIFLGIYCNTCDACFSLLDGFLWFFGTSKDSTLVIRI